MERQALGAGRRLGAVIARDFRLHRGAYLMALPIVAYYLVFHYRPMYGAVIAFKDFRPGLGILGSPWVGLRHFQDFLGSYYFWRLVRNTLLINLYGLAFAFPAPILFALLLNEIRGTVFKRTVQTVTYLPHFVSVVVICGLIVDFTGTYGLISSLVVGLGGKPSNLLMRPELFRTIYVGSNIWTNLGWGSILYLAAISGIDLALYEAATIDGAGRFRQALHVTLPGIAPTIVIMLILAVGNMMSVGWEKIILLYNPLTYDTADVVSSFVYRRGLIESDYSYSTAVGLFNSVVNFLLLIAANGISRKANQTSLW